MLEIFTIELRCGFCGTKTGEYKVSSEYGWTKETATAENCGFIDVRCNPCQAIHGTFKDMVDEYRKTYNDDALEAEQFVKRNRKKADFDKELKKKRAKIAA